MKAHIFLPIAVSLGAAQLMADRTRRASLFKSQGLEAHNGPAVDRDLQGCMDALRKMQSFNNLARHHLIDLESQELSLSGL